MIRTLLLVIALTSASFYCHAQVVQPGPPGFVRLFSAFPTSSNGNGADLTEDTIAACGYTIPAGQLANVGDTLHIAVSGNMAASTDAKSARVKLNGAAVGATATASAASGTAWRLDGYLVKNGANTQITTWYNFVGISNTSAFASSGPAALTDAATIALTVTGQNVTSSVANSVTCTALIVNFEH